MDASTLNVLAAKRRDLLTLDSRKKALESEAEAIVSELTAELPDGGPPMGIDTPLVDREGYPRADIDVFRARTLRRRFIEIQNDIKDAVRKMERGLVELAALSGGADENSARGDQSKEHALRTAPKPKPKFDPVTNQWVVKSWDGTVAGIPNGECRQFDHLLNGTDAPANAARATNRTSASIPPTTNDNRTNDTTTNTNDSTQTIAKQPFAIIDEISPDSPASTAGLELNDLLLQFDNIDHTTNHYNFTAIAKLLSEKEGQIVRVTVRRCKTMEWGEVIEEIVDLELMPQKWAGRGLLGCHIRRYEE